MSTSKDNPHKPSTEEWRAYEQDVLFQDRFSAIIQDERYLAAKAVADKRIKTATDQIRAREEKGVWVDEVLGFLDGDEPEYDEVLDGPKKTNDYWQSMTPNNDPLGWNSLAQLMNAQLVSPAQARLSYASFKPVFKGTIVVPKFIPASVERDSLFDKISTLQDYEFTEEEYNKGEVQVPIRTTLKTSGYFSYNLDPLAPSNQTYVVAEFYIRRK